MKCELVSPSSLAFLFISSTNCSSEPAMPSASTMQASLPESTVMPRIRSSDRDLAAERDEHLRPAHPPGLLAHRQRLVELELPRFELPVDDVERHQLGHRGRRHPVVRLLLEQRGTGVEIHHVGPAGGGIDRADRRVGGAAGRRRIGLRRALRPFCAMRGRTASLRERRRGDQRRRRQAAPNGGQAWPTPHSTTIRASVTPLRLAWSSAASAAAMEANGPARSR